MINRLRCWWNGHDPIIRKDMKFIIPEQKIDRGNGVVFRVVGREFTMGETTCSVCGVALDVFGTVVKKIKS